MYLTNSSRRATLKKYFKKLLSFNVDVDAINEGINKYIVCIRVIETTPPIIKSKPFLKLTER